MVLSSNDDTGAVSGRKGDLNIGSLIAELGAPDGLRRRAARQRLVKIGWQATPALIAALASPGDDARWEAAKALGAIRDPASATALVDALEDPDSGVRWLAGEALVALGPHGLIAVLEALEERSDSLWLREGAHQVLHALTRHDGAPEALPVLNALEGVEPAVEAPIAAYHALQHLRQQDSGHESSVA